MHAILEPDNVTFRLTFTKFCELDAPVQVRATREASGTNRIQVTQSGRNIATGLLGRRETQPLMERVTVPALEDAPVSSELVHRNIGFVGYFASPASVAALALLTAAMFWRIRVEEAVLVRSSGYREFASIRRRILPGVW